MSLHGNDVCLMEVEDYNLYEEEASDHAFSRNEKHSSGSKTMEAEKRIRREIANSNERRRMQSINAGFQALRTLLPRHEGEKLSKAAILQQTAEYIYSLEQEKTRLLSQNCQLKRLLNQHEGGEVPLKKRKSEILSHVTSVIPPDSTDDTLTNSRSPEPCAVITVTSASQKKDVEGGEIRALLERERRLRRLLEERLHALEGQIYPDAAPAARAARFEHTELPDCKLETEVVEEPLVEAKPVPALLPVTARAGAAVLASGAKAGSAPATPAAPLLEAAIKAEPRVEVEVLPDAGAAGAAGAGGAAGAAAHEARLYLASTSRQNLETIVEAIRHLEGDHLFGEAGLAGLAGAGAAGGAGEAPLALTKKAERAPTRPGVIVVKHS